MKKTTDAWALSLNLSSRGGYIRYVGTYYHMLDTYAEIITREAAIERKYPATVDGTEDGKPVMLTYKQLADKRKAMGPYIFSCQMLLNPVADKAMGFKREWISIYHSKVNFIPSWWVFYILADPANAKKKHNDYTTILVIAVGDDGNYYLVDGVHDRLNLTERTAALFKLHRNYRPIQTGFEMYGKDSDIQHIEHVMEEEQYRFPITALGGLTSKPDRIRKLVPLFEQKKFWVPDRLLFKTVNGKVEDLMQAFYAEYDFFPVAKTDDILDCAARMLSPEIVIKVPKRGENRILGLLGASKQTHQANNVYPLFKRRVSMDRRKSYVHGR